MFVLLLTHNHLGCLVVTLTTYHIHNPLSDPNRAYYLGFQELVHNRDLLDFEFFDCINNIHCHKVLPSSWALMIEKYSVTCIHSIAFTKIFQTFYYLYIDVYFHQQVLFYNYLLQCEQQNTFVHFLHHV